MSKAKQPKEPAMVMEPLEPLEPMQTKGSAANTLKATANHIEFGNGFLEYAAQANEGLGAKWGTDILNVPEAEICTEYFFEMLATYLTTTYKIPDGSRNHGLCLSSGTAEVYFNALLNMTRERVRLSTLLQTKEFLRCFSEPASPQAIWLSKMRAQINKLVFRRGLFNNERMDFSASEIYLPHMREMSAAFAKANTTEAAARRLTVLTLWRMAGRSGEPADITYEMLSWNMLTDSVVAQVPSKKVGKLKPVPFIAGVDRHTDWALAFGDNLVLLHGAQHYSSDAPMYLLPDVGGTKDANTRVTNYIKGLQPPGRTGALEKYKKVAVHSLPPQPTAQGIRPGASDTMALCMPAEFVVHTTGHELTGSCGSLFTYLDTRLALCIPGALALADWPPYPYGQLGPGPRSPTLEVLVTLGDRGGTSVNMDVLEKFIDVLFGFHDATHPTLLGDGPLRILMHTTTATLIMYYQERFEACEMLAVITHMREAFAHPEVKMGTMVEAHSTFIAWAKAIREQFDIDNLGLKTREAHGLTEQVVSSVQHLHTAQQALQKQVAEVAGRLVRIETGQGQIIELLNCLLGRGVAPLAPVAPVAEIPTLLIPLIPRTRPMLQPGEGAGGGALEATYELPTGPGQFYIDCFDQSGKGPLEVPFIKDDSKNKRRCDAKKVLAAYVAMTLPEEYAVLANTPRQMTICGPMVTQLTSLIVAIIKHSYSANKIACPKEFGNGGTVKVNTLVANLRDSKIIIDSNNFRRWRAARNSAGAGSSTGVGERREAEDEPDESPVRKSPRPLGPPGREDPEASASEEGEEEDF